MFSISEEDELLHGHVVTRLDDIARVERITKDFYEQFKTEHDHFVKAVGGIQNAETQAWYASVMINRLMFLYFIQDKGFLDGDKAYLLHKLEEAAEAKKTKTNDYYRVVLCPLFCLVGGICG